MSKISLTDLVNLQNENTAVNAINNNSADIETAFDNTLSRDGTSPNQMGADLDMNSNRILNLPAPGSATDPIRLQDISDFEASGLISIPNNTVLGNQTGADAIPTPQTITGSGSVAMSVSPTFTGIPAAPTAGLGTNTTQLATTAFVSNAVAGANSPLVAPEGRLTLTSGFPVMATSVAGATTVYYTPYGGNAVPVYTGAVFAVQTFTELLQATNDTSKSPAAVVANSNYDMFSGSTLKRNEDPSIEA